MPDELESKLAIVLLETMRKSLHLHVGEVRYRHQDGREVWRISATSNTGETWIGEHEDYYQAAILLAETVGFELEDG